MSKSLGNVVDPRLVIDGGKNLKQEPAYGADVLRLWVSSVDYTSDVLIGASAPGWRYAPISRQGIGRRQSRKMYSVRLCKPSIL